MSLSTKGLLKTKKSKKSKEKNQINFPVKMISDIFQTIDGKYKIIAKITPVNADMFSDDELDITFESIESALNTYDGRIGIYIQSRRIDIDMNIYNIEEDKQNLNNELKIEILDKQKEYLENIKSRSRNVLNFYIVLESNQSKYSVAKNSLIDAIRNIKNELESSNIYCNRLNENDFKELLYEKSNPETSLIETYSEDWGLYEIQPKAIKKHKDGRHLEIDNRLFRFYSITRYPQEVDKYRWLKRLLKIDGDINIAITLNPKDKSKVLEELSNAVKEIGSKALEGGIPEHMKIEYENQKQSAKDLINDIGSNNSNLYNTNITIGISSKNMDDLNTLGLKLKGAISSSGCQTTELRNKKKEPLWITYPILYDCKITREYVWNLTSSDIASLIIFDSSEMMESKGTLIGNNVTSDGLVILDMLNKQKYNNGHMAVIADSGAGKTFFLMLDAIRHYPYVDYTIMFDVKGDFYFPWGKRYDFTPTSNINKSIITNPFHIRNTLISDNTNNDDEGDLSGILSSKIMNIIPWFKRIIPDMTAFQEALLEEDIRDCYKEVNLTFESKELPKEFCTLSTLDEILKRKIDDLETSEKAKEERINLKASLNPYVRGAYSSMFNGQTNWDYDTFTVFGINNVPKAVQNQLYELLLKDTASFCRKDGTYNPDIKRVYVDESHRFADAKNPQTLEFLAQDLIKEGRGFGVYTVTATQNIRDYTYVEPYGQAILDNSFFKVFFRIGESDKEKIKELYDLSKKEMKIINPKNRNSNKGRGIFIAGSQRVEFQVRASKWELSVIDPQQYEEIYKEQSPYRRL